MIDRFEPARRKRFDCALHGRKGCATGAGVMQDGTDFASI
jgi:hypothetical protein